MAEKYTLQEIEQTEWEYTAIPDAIREIKKEKLSIGSISEAEQLLKRKLRERLEAKLKKLGEDLEDAIQEVRGYREAIAEVKSVLPSLE